MKFTKVILILLSLLMCFCSCNASNGEREYEMPQYDSLAIEAENLEALQTYFQDPPLDSVIRIYRCDPITTFAQGGTIVDLMQNGVFLVLRQSTDALNENETTEFDLVNVAENTVNILEDPYKTATGVIADISLSDPTQWFNKAPSTADLSDIEIRKTFYISAMPPSDEGLYIYFITNHGDFVFYKINVQDEASYLIPIEDFYDFTKIAYKDRKKNAEKDGWAVTTDLYDFTPYAIG